MFGWFKKKPVEFELHDGKGGVHKGTTSTERIVELQAKGVLGEKLDGCVSYYWDPRLPKPITKNLIIGEDIRRETYEKFKDAEGNVYVVGVFEAGEMKLSYVSKPLWDDMMRATGNA